MAMKTRLPMGIENFERIRKEGFYYVDKTGLIIPNKEIQWIFSWQIHAWFREETIRNTDRLERFSGALQENDVAAESAMIIE